MEQRKRDRSSYQDTYVLIGTCMALLTVSFTDASYVLPATILGGFGLMAAVRIHEQLRYPTMKRKGDA